MIKGAHAMFYSSEADMGVHPADPTRAAGEPAGTHDISFYCDDIHATVAELKDRGVVFDGEVADAGLVVIVAHTWPKAKHGTNVEVGRIISARKATAHERKAYEEGDF